MINVSKEFQLLMNQRTDFKQNAEILFANGKSLALIEKDFTVSNNGVVDGSQSNGIPLGVAVCRNIQIELMNDDDRFSEYDFFGAKIRLYLTFQLSDTVESIEYGTFTVLTPETYGTTVIITALDDMYKADRDYITSLTFPATIGEMFRDACNTLGIPEGSTTFLNDNFVVNEKPTDITFRQLFGYISMIAGGNARVDRTGRLCIVTYDFSNMESIYNSVLNGGSYNPWDNPVNIDGGSFEPWNEGDVADGGEFGDRKHFHVLGSWKDLKVDTDDVVITGVQTVYTDESDNEQTSLYGTEGYVLSFENPLISEQEETAVELIGNVMVGGRFRQFSGDIVANPTCEFMDTALLLDRKGNVYISFITDVDFQFFGFTSIKNSAEPTLRNSAKSYSEATKTFVKARKLVEKERTAREQAVAQLAKDLKESSGLFATEEVQADGSIIYYMHDKPTLAESMIIWKLTTLAFGISTDGGKTYPYGFTVNGEVITRLLYAEGIDADYINTGALKISDKNGNTLFSADYDTKEVYINADNVKIGSENVKSYINSVISLATDAIRLEVTERTSIYNEQVNTLQGGMDGSIDLSFFTDLKAVGETVGTTVTNISGKQAVNTGYSLYQDVSIPAGTYLLSYEWLRNSGLYINAGVRIYDLNDNKVIYEKDLGFAWPSMDTWNKEDFEFVINKTKRIRFEAYFEAPWDYPDRTNSLYLTNIALYGTAQSVSDAVADVKAQLNLQANQIEARVEKDGVIASINLTSEKATIQADRIDLVGLVTATEFTTKFATISALNATNANVQKLITSKASIEQLNSANAEIQNLKSSKIDASTVKADYMEVRNWTSNGYIKAEKIDVNSLAARFTRATVLNVGLLSASNLRVGIYEFKPQYNATLGFYVLKGTPYSG